MISPAGGFLHTLTMLCRRLTGRKEPRGLTSSLGPLQQQAAGFLDFVFAHYVRVGVEELDQEKLTPLLRLKSQLHLRCPGRLGTSGDIGQVFIGSQKYLYQHQVVA